MTVVPGRQVDTAPFDFFRSTQFDVHPRWRVFGDEQFDLGVVWLDAAVGEHVGWFGFGSRALGAQHRTCFNVRSWPFYDSQNPTETV